MYAAPIMFYMKRISCIISFYLLLGTSILFAQATSEEPETIFDTLQEKEVGKGVVTVHQSEALRNMIGKRLHGESV